MTPIFWEKKKLSTHTISTYPNPSQNSKPKLTFHSLTTY